MTQENNETTQMVPLQTEHKIPKRIRPHGKVSCGLFFDPRKHFLDGRTRIAKIIKNVSEHLLEHFPEPIPAGAILIAKQASYKALRLRAFEHHILITMKTPAKTTDESYISLSNSLTQDIKLLHQMARDHTPVNKVPGLDEYLRSCNAKIIQDDEENKD